MNLSNDNWVASEELAEHQLAIAPMRAVEQRRFLIRSSIWGPSAIVDQLGVVQGRTATEYRTRRLPKSRFVRTA